MDPNRDIESPCKLTSDWAFTGYYADKKGNECAFPIGVYSTYAAGVAQANAWMRHEKRSIRWEGERLYEPLTTEEEYE